MPKVYIPQVTEKFDHGSERRVPLFDLSPAAVFGQLVPVLDPTDSALMVGHLMPQVRERLSDFEEGDFLLATGDPVVISACAAIIASKVSQFTVLKWDRKLSAYIPMTIKLQES